MCIHTQSSNSSTGMHMSFVPHKINFLPCSAFLDSPLLIQNQSTTTCASSASSYFLFLFKRIFFFFLLTLTAKQMHRYKSLLRIWRLTSSYLYNISIIPHISTVVKKHFNDRKKHVTYYDNIWHFPKNNGVHFLIPQADLMKCSTSWSISNTQVHNHSYLQFLQD